MLEYLRNAADKPVAKVLMGILIFSFVGWGVAEWVFGLGSSDTTLMRVGDAKISIQQYNSVKNANFSNMSRADQRALYSDATKMSEFQTNVIQELKTTQMIKNHADDLGYIVSDHRIADIIRTMPEFALDGHFSGAKFDAILRNSGLSEAQLASILRSQELQKMVTLPTTVIAKTPRFAATAMYNARGTERDIEFATVKFSDFSAPAPTDDQLREYYAANPEKIAETRDFSYALVPAEMDKPDAYEAALKIAQKMEDDIIGGESVSDAAKRHNAKFAQHRNVSATKMPNDTVINGTLMARVFDLDENTESELIETKSGFVIIRVDKITPEHNAEFESVRNKLVNDWRHSETKKQAYIRANEILTDAKKSGKISNKKSATVSRTNGAPMPVLVAAFKNKIGDKVIVDGENEFYVLTVINEKVPTKDDKKIDSVTDEATKMHTRHIMEDYESYLEREYPTKINEKTFNRWVK